jgi:FAD/FMN-containing dehydrogenase
VAVQPHYEKDVAEVVRYGRASGIPFAARTGHHAVTTTMRHLKNGILVDMRRFKDMHFDPETQQVRIGGGVIMDDFVRFLQSRKMELSKRSPLPKLVEWNQTNIENI